MPFWNWRERSAAERPVSTPGTRLVAFRDGKAYVSPLRGTAGRAYHHGRARGAELLHRLLTLLVARGTTPVATAALSIGVLLMACAAPAVAPSLSPSLAAFNRLIVLEQAGADDDDWIITGSAHAAQLAHLQAWALKNSIIVTITPLDRKRLFGATIPTQLLGWTIFIDAKSAPDGQLYTLLHELAHVFSPKNLTTAQSEIFAELIAVQAADKHGLDGWRQTAGYLAAHATTSEQFWTLHAHATEMDALVARFSRAMD